MRRHLKTNNAFSCNSSKTERLLKTPKCFFPPGWSDKHSGGGLAVHSRALAQEWSQALDA